jgi:hypothetical protein
MPDDAEDAEIGEIAEEAGNEFQRMLTEAEAADGQFNNALLEENQLTNKIAETRNDLAAAEDSLGEAQGNLEDRASQMYMNGQDGFLGMLLGARNFSDFKDLLGLWVQLLDQDQKEVEEWRESRNQLEQNSRDLEAQLEEWEQTREEASTKKEEAEIHVEQAQELFEAQDQKVQEKIEENRAREAELAWTTWSRCSRMPAGSSRPSCPPWKRKILTRPVLWARSPDRPKRIRPKQARTRPRATSRPSSLLGKTSPRRLNRLARLERRRRIGPRRKSRFARPRLLRPSAKQFRSGKLRRSRLPRKFKSRRRSGKPAPRKR